MIYQSNETEQDLFSKFTREFLHFLSINQIDEAWAMLDKETTEHASWDKETFEQFLELNPHCIFDDPFVTPLPKDHRVESYEYDDGSGFAFEYDLTTGGELNDFTLMLDFIRVENEYYVYLTDIQVM